MAIITTTVYSFWFWFQWYNQVSIFFKKKKSYECNTSQRRFLFVYYLNIFWMRFGVASFSITWQNHIQ